MDFSNCDSKLLLHQENVCQRSFEPDNKIFPDVSRNTYLQLNLYKFVRHIQISPVSELFSQTILFLFLSDLCHTFSSVPFTAV